VGKSAAAHEIDPGFGYGAHGFKADTPGSLQNDAAFDDRDGLPQHIQRKIVEKHYVGPGSDGFGKLPGVFHFDFDAQCMGSALARATDRFLYTSRCRDMVVLDQDTVGQAEAVIPASSVPHGFLFQASPQGGCLSCIEQLASGPGHGLRHFTRQGGDPAQPLDEIQGGSLAGQKCPRPSLYPEYGNIWLNPVPIGEQAFYPDFRVEKFENSSKWFRA
jgi:hypothetical protein